MTRDRRLGRLGRYGLLSVGNTVLGEALLALFVGVMRWPAAVANLVAACIVLGPVYVVARWWVWRLRGRTSVIKETLPFWVVSIAAVLLSTASAGGAEAWAHGLHLSHSAYTAMVLVSVLCSYGVLWLVRFFVLDLLVFRGRSEVP